MPRTARSTPAGFAYHVLNRGNHRGQIFHCEDDYGAFSHLLAQGVARFPVRLLAFCLMPYHIHLALWPQNDDGVSALMHWLLTTHATRYRKKHRVTGHVWQGRFRAFPSQEADHLLTVLRYLERNPLRAGLVTSAEQWRWSSLRWHLHPPRLTILDPGPVARPADWLRHVNVPETEPELKALRRCAERGTPFGDEAWLGKVACQLGLEYTVRSRGRPTKQVTVPRPDGLRTPLFDGTAEE